MEAASPNRGQQDEPTMLVLNEENEPVRETLTELMNSFEVISIRHLAEEDRTCPCCHSKYMEIRDGELPLVELPVKTACGHILGEDCLKKLLPNNTCPMCRSKLFLVPDEHENEDEEDEEECSDEEAESSLEAPEDRHYSPDVSDIRRMIEVYQSWPRSREWLVGEIRRIGAFREARLYAELLAQRATLPGPRTFGPALHGMLDWRQDRALCHEIHRLAGFE